MAFAQTQVAHGFALLAAAAQSGFGRHVFDFLSTHLTGPAAYAAVVFLLTVCGLGVPVPEDIILITGGFIAGSSGQSPFVMMACGLLGIVFGDSIIYTLGRRFGLPMAQQTPLRRVLTEDRLTRVQSLFHKYGQVILVAARFMPGVRAVAFFSAGSMKVPYWKFISYDGAAALISAPLWVFLGWKYNGEITRLFELAERAKHYVMGALLVGLVAFAVHRFLVWRRSPKGASVRQLETHVPNTGAEKQLDKTGTA